MKLTGRQVMKISALADKLNLQIDMGKDVEEMGVDVIWQVLKKAHKAEDEVSDVLSIFLNCKPEEALDMNLIDKWEEFKDSEKGKQFIDFFSSFQDTANQK